MNEALQPVIGIACVQADVTLKRFFTEEAFGQFVERLMEKAVASLPEDVPRLVVFPEDFAAGLLFVGEGETLQHSSGLRGAVATLVRKHFTSVMAQRMRHRVGWVRAFALSKAEQVARAYRRIFAGVARRYKAYVLAGTVLLPDVEFGPDGEVHPKGGDVYNVAYLFDSDGDIVGGQRKAFLIDLEGSDALDLRPGRVADLVVYDTPFGRIGTAICFDAFQEPVIQHLDGLGVDILLQPSANPKRWDKGQQQDWLKGAWHAVVERKMAVYAVNPMLVGRLLDIEFQGQSSIIAQDVERVRQAAASIGLTVPQAEAGYAALAARDGFLQVTSGWTEEEVLSVLLPHPKLVKDV